jgi:F0F1-type ATP synthase membrane subunit b/b'
MEKIIDNMSFGIFFTQTIMFILLFIIIYYLIKLYKKVIKYLDKHEK